VPSLGAAVNLSPVFSSNGIDVTTGDYLSAGSVAEFAGSVADWLLGGAEAGELRARRRRSTERFYAPVHGVDVLDLAQAGWGAVFAADADPAIRDALRPLLAHRRDAASAEFAKRYRELAGPTGYRVGETKQTFLRRLGIAPGPVVPDVLPYYLLLVGGPDEIPFEVQYQLGVQHAVGRIAFDTPEEYRRYAANVVAAESSSRRTATRPTRLALFAPRHEGDEPTGLSTEHLVSPLAAAFGSEVAAWEVVTAVACDATKDRLLGLLNAPDPPDILLAAGHGVGLPAEHAAQRRNQGALLCQDWPGPGSGPVDGRLWFGADDVTRLAGQNLTGLITILVACFGAGTPRHDGFQRPDTPRVMLARRPFVAALPQALLGREGGGLAAVGHVDRVWSYSFLWPGAGPQTATFRSLLGGLREGRPIGSALEYITGRYAELAADLSGMLQEREQGRRLPDATVAELWAACSDARSVLLLGDPAVRASACAVAPGADQTPRRGIVNMPAPRVAPTNASAAAPPPASPLMQARPRPRAIEVMTYIADDPAAAAYDPATDRITGAVPVVFSRVEHDGRAAHVVRSARSAAGDGPDPIDPGEREAVVALHIRLVAASLDRAGARVDVDGEEVTS
jgi:hypothetical protein